MIALKWNYCLVIRRNFVKIFQRKYICNVYVIYCLILFVVLIYSYSHNDIDSEERKSQIFYPTNLKEHYLIVAEYYGLRKSWKTSNLGSLMFKNEKATFTEKNRTFVILVWKHWEWLKKRHVNNFGPKKSEQNTLTDCSVNNCVFKGNDKEIDKVDVVLVHIMRGIIPKVTKRNTKQIWVFLEDESPRNAFSLAKRRPNLEKWANVFNWSMSYRSDSDVPVPYGRTVPLPQPVNKNVTYESIARLVPNLKSKQSDVLVAVMISNCNVPYRMKILEGLQKYINVDVYGKCSKDKKNRCPGHFKADCHVLDPYYFYLVLENSICRQYITEKVFHNAYSKGAIPILVGPSLHDCKMLLPPNSYIYFEDNSSFKELAAKITNTHKNMKEYFSFHLWRNHFEARNEHGYFGTKSYHLCRLCEALNYNKEEEYAYSFNDLQLFLNPNLLCNNRN